MQASAQTGNCIPFWKNNAIMVGQKFRSCDSRMVSNVEEGLRESFFLNKFLFVYYTRSCK